MRIFIDIGHPAHVHYFRNFIKLMQEKGHEFYITARERSIIHYLLNFYNIAFSSRGKGSNRLIGKFFYMFLANIRLYLFAKKFKPDIFLSFASPYTAQVSKLLGKPHIAIDDTEHARFGQFFYRPFTDVFLNPSCFERDFGKKQIKFNSLTELFYLYNASFEKKKIRDLLHLTTEESYAVLRFVSWEAHHDKGHSGMDISTKKKIVDLLVMNGIRVFISSESENIHKDLLPYVMDIPPESMHGLLSESIMLIAESGTMASEAAILGTPVVYVNSLPLMGYLKAEQKAGALFHFSTSIGVIEKVNELIEISGQIKKPASRIQKLLADKIDPTAFLVWFIENYPDSFIVMKESPDFQSRFK